MNLVHELPGTTFSGTRERGGYDSDAKTVLTLAEFQQWMAWRRPAITANPMMVWAGGPPPGVGGEGGRGRRAENGDERDGVPGRFSAGGPEIIDADGVCARSPAVLQRCF